MFDDRTNISFNRFKLSVLSMKVYFEGLQDIVVTPISDDEISIEFNKEIKYF